MPLANCHAAAAQRMRSGRAAKRVQYATERRPRPCLQVLGGVIFNPQSIQSHQELHVGFVAKLERNVQQRLIWRISKDQNLKWLVPHPLRNCRASNLTPRDAPRLPREVRAENPIVINDQHSSPKCQAPEQVMFGRLIQSPPLNA